VRNNTGFTIIELIIVIAIIAVLAAIVMVNVVQYIAKSKDAANEESLHSLNIAAAIYFSDNGNYNDVCAGNSVFSSMKLSGKIDCIDYNILPSVCTGNQWAVQSYRAQPGQCWCVDSRGNPPVPITCFTTSYPTVCYCQ
jgi:prepilin-type N-terminal cleavage/methylation domain-containing protein